MPIRANQARGKQNGQENLEESKEDRSDEAVDDRKRKTLRPVFHCQERAEGHDAAGEKHLEWQAGRCRGGNGPFRDAAGCSGMINS